MLVMQPFIIAASQYWDTEEVWHGHMHYANIPGTKNSRYENQKYCMAYRFFCLVNFCEKNIFE